MDDTAAIACPSCSAPWVIALDPSAGPRQEYVEDCSVCCQPAVLAVRFDRRGRARVEARAE